MAVFSCPNSNKLHNISTMKVQKLTLSGDFRINHTVDLFPMQTGEFYEVEVKKLLNSFDEIDIGKYSKEKDEEYVYEDISYGLEHDLGPRVMAKILGMDARRITAIRERRAEPTQEELDAIGEYLIDVNFSMEDFYEFRQFKKIKYKRNIKTNEDFYWLIGFIQARATNLKGKTLFTFDSDEMSVMNELKSHLKKLELEFMEYTIAGGAKKNLAIKSEAFNLFIFDKMDKTFSARFLPGDYFPTHDKRLQNWVNGIVAGSGGNPENKKQMVKMPSKEGQEQLKIILDYLGYECTVKCLPTPNLSTPPKFSIKWENEKRARKEVQFLTIRQEKTLEE